HCRWRYARDIDRIMSGARDHGAVGKSADLDRIANAVDQVRGKVHRLRRPDPLLAIGKLEGREDVGERLAKLSFHPVKAHGLGVPEIDGEEDFAWNDVAAVRLVFQESHGADG